MQVVLGGVNIVEPEDQDQIIPVLRAIVHRDFWETCNSNGSLDAVSSDVGEATMKNVLFNVMNISTVSERNVPLTWLYHNLLIKHYAA